jgi:plasmid replication initiation protein
MSNEIVKYHNDMNRLIMRDWTPEEMDFFFAIVWKIRNQSTKEISVGKNELSKLAEYSRKHNIELRRIFRRLSRQMSRLIWENETFDGKKYRYEVMPMFTRASFEWNKEMTDMTAHFQITDAFTYLVNDLSANFTSWELKEFTQLRSTYSKTAYRLLKQYRSTGEREFDIEEFKMLFGIPKSYRAADINRRVFKPILTELKPYFLDLKIKPVKKRTHGNPIIAYRFTFHPSLIEEWDDEKYDKKSLATSQRVKRSKNANDPTWYDDKQTSQASDELIEQALEVQKKRKEQQ